MNKLLTWITNLGNIAKILPLVFAVAGAVAWYNGHVIKKYNERSNNIELAKKVTTIINQNDSMFIMFNKLKEDQQLFNIDMLNKMDAVESTMGVVRNQLGQHIVKTATKDDILDWMSAFEKKNSRWREGSTSLILFKQ